MNPAGRAPHKNPDTKVLGHEKQVAPVSVKCVNITPECDKTQESIVSGVKSTVIEQGDCVPLFDVRVSCWDDKFLNSILTYNKKSALCTKCLFSSCKNQTDFDFGFLSISDFIMPHVMAERSYKCLTPLKMHAMVKASAQQKYLHCRIPVPSQLNIAA